jgi:hypothetical protein
MVQKESQRYNEEIPCDLRKAGVKSAYLKELDFGMK